MSNQSTPLRCGVCSREPEAGRDFHCASCARSVVYQARVDYVRVLLEKQALEEQVVAATTSNTSANAAQSDGGSSTLSSTWRQNNYHLQVHETRRRIADAREHQATMQKELDQYKDLIEDSKKRNITKRQALHSIKANIPERLQSQSTAIKNNIVKGSSSISHLEHKSASNRAHLCREAALLMRLRQKRRQRNGQIREQYSISGLILPDLKELNNARCADLTAVLCSVAHLVVLVAFYLGIRLPAEITLPHRDYPLPTINTPSSSYVGRTKDFPGSGSLPTNSNNPVNGKSDPRGSHKPRPLFVGSDDRDERLAQIAKKEPLVFNLFVEGLALLAWDVAWLCRSQIYTSGTNTWEEICNIGRNLHQLLIAPPQAPPLARVLPNRTVQHRASQGRDFSPSQDSAGSAGNLGQGSHLSAYNFLGSSARMDSMRSWKHVNYTTVADALRKNLLAEMNNAEWELLQEQEWDDGGEQFDEAVFVKPRGTEANDIDDARSIMATRTRSDEPIAAQNRAPGTSGWTKLKSREKA